MNDIDKMNSSVEGALYYLMTEIWEYSPDKDENELTKQAHSDISLALAELSAIKQRAEEYAKDYQLTSEEIYCINYIIKGEE